MVVVLSTAIGDNDTEGFHTKALESMLTRMIMVAMTSARVAVAVMGVASEVVLVPLVVIYRVTFPISGELEFPQLRRRLDYRHHSPPPVSKIAQATLLGTGKTMRG